MRISSLIFICVAAQIHKVYTAGSGLLEGDDDAIDEINSVLGGTAQFSEEEPLTSNGATSNEEITSTDAGLPSKPIAPNEECACMSYTDCKVPNVPDPNNGGGSGGNYGPGPNPGPGPVNDDPDNIPPELNIDIRFGPESQCGHYFEICCNNVRDNSTTNDIRNPDYVHTVCGKRNGQGVGFHATGTENQEAQFGEFPWMAAIVSPERRDGTVTPVNVFVCGGSLISPRVILTAAHCVYKKRPQELTIRLGEWDTQTSNEIYPHKDYKVAEIIVHEDFYVGALHNDIALLILHEQVKFAPHIDTVCLPPGNGINFDGLRCYASGWGRDSFGKEGKYQVILKKLDLPVVSRDNCEWALKRTRLGHNFRLHGSFVCAGGEKNRDTCRGDGGSPLVCKLPGTDAYVQYGIVAWGIGCGEEGVPGVYVNVPMFIPWITKKMTQARFDTTYFKILRG